MTAPYLGHLVRLKSAVKGIVEIPPIPWITIQRKYSSSVLWTQYSNVYLDKEVIATPLDDPPLADYDIYADAGGQYEYWNFKIRSQWMLGVLLDNDGVTTLDPDGALDYVNGYFSGDIPALCVRGGELSISTSGTWRIDGSNIYYVPTGSLYVNNAVVQRSPNFGPAPALNTPFILDYNNPDPYTGGIFPPGTGNANYDLNRVFVSGGFSWAEYTKLPD